MLSNQRILITGANGGIGNSIAELLLKNKANLEIFYYKNRNLIDELLEKNQNQEQSIGVHQVDLTNSSQLYTTLSKVLEKGDIDCFVHSVSLPIEIKNITDLDWSEFQKHIDIQTKSFLQIVKSLIPLMKSKKRGKIISVLTSSIIGKPPIKMSGYLVGKYSLLGLSKALAVELGSFGITVNCISPSMTNTNLIENFPSKMKEISANQVPLGRLAEPLDVASVVLFLCSQLSDYISGENIIVSGGQTIK